MDDPLGRKLLIVVLLLFVNAFFAAAEIAVISLNDSRVHYDAENGDPKAKKLLRLVDRPTRFLSTIQIAITLAGFLSSAFAADTFSEPLVDWLINTHGWQVPAGTLNSVSVIVITLILSYFTLVFGELVPKRIAMAKSDKVIDLTYRVLLGADAVFSPLVWLLTVSTNGILRLLHIDPNAEQEAVSEEEIRLMVDIGEEKGAIEATEKEMIDNIFEFNNITADSVMVHRPDMVVVRMDDSPEAILRLIRETGRSRYPVCGDDIDDVQGVLLARDFLLGATDDRAAVTVQSLLTPAMFVPESITADRLFRQMQDKQQHMAIVLDEYGGTAGLITMEDLLEEIVGNIYDESDRPEDNDITKLENDLWRVAGSCPMDDLTEVLSIEPPDGMNEEFDTLGGWIFSELDEIPPDGTRPEMTIGDLHMQVESIEDHRIEWVLIRRLPADTQS